MMNGNRMIGRTAAIVALAAMGLSTGASAKVQLTVETEYRLGYDANPFLSAGSDTSATYMETSIQPTVSVVTAKGTTALTGHFDRTAFFEKYGRSDEYGGELSTQQRVTNSLTVFGRLGYDSQVIGQGDDEVTGSTPGSGTDSTDVNLIGQRQRVDTYSASGGFQYQVSSKDTLSVNGGYTASRYQDRGVVVVPGVPVPGVPLAPNADSNTYGGQAGWQHALNAKSKIGVRGSVYKIDYDTPGLSTLVMQPQVTFTSKLSPTWTVDAAAGMSFSKLNRGGTSEHAQGFAGSLQLCKVGARDDFCIVADRSVSASGAGQTVERSQVGVNYRRLLNERLAVRWNGVYSRSEKQKDTLQGALLIPGLPTRQYVSGRAGVEYEAWRGIKFGVEGHYRDFFGGTFPVKADYGGNAFASINLATR